jgi:hypothetical protein
METTPEINPKTNKPYKFSAARREAMRRGQRRARVSPATPARRGRTVHVVAPAGDADLTPAERRMVVRALEKRIAALDDKAAMLRQLLSEML